jgi:DNA-binding NtrC family response regulator
MNETLLVVDDDVQLRMLFKRFLAKSGFDVHEAATLAGAREIASQRSLDGALIDQMLPDGSGIDLIAELKAMNPDMAIIVITGRGDIPLAVDAMRRGADNFLTKPVNLADLELLLRKSLEIGTLRRIARTHQLLQQGKQPYFGSSPAMRPVVEMSRLASENDHTVLLTGDTGTGKGVLARWIHDNSGRRSGAFVDVNCSGLRGELLASELFGHAKGAFTTAIKDREGLLDAADCGTFFLDEIGDMDVSVQAQFLKAIEEKSYRRLGEVKIRRSDFRLICATNKDLSEEAKAGRFRRDLFYRIQVMPIPIPSLYEHVEDLPGLVRHILDACGYPGAEVSNEVMMLLRSYTWPGNIRELKNVLERAALLARGGPLHPAHFPGLGISTPSARPAVCGLHQMEQDSIRAALEQTGGDVGAAAKQLGISAATVYRKIKKYDITTAS